MPWPNYNRQAQDHRWLPLRHARHPKGSADCLAKGLAAYSGTYAYVRRRMHAWSALVCAACRTPKIRAPEAA